MTETAKHTPGPWELVNKGYIVREPPPSNVTCTSCRYFVESRHYGQLEESNCKCAYNPELVKRRPETPACHNYERKAS